VEEWRRGVEESRMASEVEGGSDVLLVEAGQAQVVASVTRGMGR
jgi:hypothetical protein